MCALAAVPWVVMRLNPPAVRRTPEAAEFAAREARAMGALSRDEKLLLMVFIGVCALWITQSFHHWNNTPTALLGVLALMLAGVLTWDDMTPTGRGGTSSSGTGVWYDWAKR